MEFVMDAVRDYGLIGVFVLILLEYACFPLPSEIVLPFSGAVASQSGWTYWEILLLSTIAGVLGALACYIIGYFGGYPLVEKIGRRFPKMQKGLDASRKKYVQYASFASGVGRVIPLCRTYISFIAGISRQNIWSYLLSTAVGVAVWNSVVLALGFLLAENWELATEYYEQYKMILIPIVLVVVAVLVIRFILRRRKKVDPCDKRD